MYATVLLFLLVQAWTFTGTFSYQVNHELARKSLDSNTGALQIYDHDNNTQWHVYNQTTLYRTTSHDERIVPQRKTTPPNYWNQLKHADNVGVVRWMSNFESFASKEKSQNIPNRSGRFKRATSKFTGLVVGASKDVKLKQSVMQTLTTFETSIWSLQSQFSKPFIPGNPGPSVILGTFNSDLRTNFHGHGLGAQYRRSKDYSISDVNSMTTLLILQCLIEASLYGSATTPTVSNMSIAVESLKAFYSHTYPRGSSILTMWPEKLRSDSKEWVNLPENIIGIPVKENTTYNQLQHLEKSCNCEPAKSALKEMSENTYCKDHFATPLSDQFKDTATPPDFLTSFSNLALGSLLQARHITKNTAIYKAESELWLTANSDLKILTNKLKSMVIFYPSKMVTVTSDGSIVDNLRNITFYLKEKIITSEGKEIYKYQNIPLQKAISQNVASQNVTSQNVTSIDITPDTNVSSSDQSFVGDVGDQDAHNRTVRSVGLASPDISVNDSSESENATEEVVRSALLSNLTTTPPTLNSGIIFATASTKGTSTTSSPTVPTTVKAAVPPEITLDPRRNQIISSESYYTIRHFLNAEILVEKNEVILIPSLISDDIKELNNLAAVSDNDRSIWHNGKMYHSYNTVNLMTTATTLHALVISSMSGLIDIRNDVILKRIVVSSIRVLTWYMNNTQDLAAMVTLSTFPSRYQLYWAASRIVFQLNSKQAQATKMFKFADQEISAFRIVLRDKMTFSILQSITDAGLGQDGKTRVYIDDFIGVADVDDKGKSLAGGDDRLFASSMAISALIGTWTVQKDDGVLQFDKDIGDPVRIAVNSLANWVHGVMGEHSTSNLNAFMSEQIKNCQTMPARYPQNIVTLSDGNQTYSKEPKNDLRYGVKGYLLPHEYQDLLGAPRYGYKTRGGGLEDLNSPTSVFRFWESPAYTKAAALLAIAQAANLQVDVHNN